jgi:hypothetical protein
VKAIKNKWPCCGYGTYLRLDNLKPGDEITRTCPRCFIDYRITFGESKTFPDMMRVIFEKQPSKLRKP